MKTFATILGISLALALFALPSYAAHSTWSIDGSIVSSQLQSYTVPGPPGAGQEEVCLIGVSVNGQLAVIWMQGEGPVDLCLDLGANRVGDRLIATGTVKAYFTGGSWRIATFPYTISVSEY